MKPTSTLLPSRPLALLGFITLLASPAFAEVKLAEPVHEPHGFAVRCQGAGLGHGGGR